MHTRLVNKIRSQSHALELAASLAASGDAPGASATLRTTILALDKVATKLEDISTKTPTPKG